MNSFKIIPSLKLTDEQVITQCLTYSNNGADELLLFDHSDSDQSHDDHIALLKKIKSTVDIPFIVGGSVHRLEDVKKYIYAGADKVFLDASKESNILLIKEASERFGKEKIALYFSKECSEIALQQLQKNEISLIIIEESLTPQIKSISGDIKILLLTDKEILEVDNSYYGISIQNVCPDEISSLKLQYKEKGFPVFQLESSLAFSALKTNQDGLIPVIVQDFKTNEVLMMAYMNEEAFQLTIKTGKMTYYSRSREEIWIKGLTSGHFQYLKELRCDCDNDTLLAKVFQVGAACHTGNYSCFYNTIAKKETVITNPYEVFQQVFQVILDRKVNPKEGSYTNYLFDKGIDKILKKLGEEATEIIIAAKNPNSEEIKYEIADFLYHMMVLMAQRDVSWEEITEELNRR